MNFLLKNQSVLVLIMFFALAFIGCERKPAGGSTGGNSTGGDGGGGKKTVAFAQMENTGPWRIAESESMKIGSC
jgi:hypothetical protein